MFWATRVHAAGKQSFGQRSIQRSSLQGLLDASGYALLLHSRLLSITTTSLFGRVIFENNLNPTTRTVLHLAL